MFRIDPKAYPGGIAIWGALNPVLNTTGKFFQEGVHVHARTVPNGKKVIDQTFSAVEVVVDLAGGTAVIDLEAAKAYVVASVFGLSLDEVTCSHCGEQHLDRGKYATFPHRKHLCAACGREFYAGTRNIGNPIMVAKKRMGSLAIKRSTKPAAHSKLEVTPETFPKGVQIWGSNPAMVWTAEKLEEEGIHVHGYDGKHGKPLVDDTVSGLELAGEELDPTQVRVLMVQQTLPELAGAIDSLTCPQCNRSHFDHTLVLATEPHIEHTCDECGHSFKTSKAVVSNPAFAQCERARSLW